MPLALIVLGLFGSSNRADAGTIIYDSTTNGNNGVFGLISDANYAESFSTGSNAVVLTSVSAVFNRYANDTGTITANLLADAGAAPGTLLTTIGTAVSASLVTFTPSSPYLLAANTRYWVQLTEPVQAGGAGVGWGWTYNLSGLTGVAGEYALFNGTVHTTASFGAYLMTVTVDAPPPPPPPPTGIPEPGTLALLAFGGFAVVVKNRRRLGRTG
jgi:hypothetical protein